jgi:L-seryl-tRNA(Ser) seleniumtransferase
MPIPSEENREDPRRDLLRRLPAVDRLLELARAEACFELIPRAVVVEAIRGVIDAERQRIRAAAGPPPEAPPVEALMAQVKSAVRLAMRPNLRRVVNATGIVIHTNLGRSLLARPAIENIVAVAGRYSNLEYDLKAGRRGSRYSAVRDLICAITGAEDAMVVNNNAGAVLLCLDTMARGRRVIVSRGELVEIGGSFRVPDVMAKSGAVLHEVGTTNRTHRRDYENAIGEQTALLLKVHWSNFSIVGFTAQVPLAELVGLGAARGIPVMEDLGSGTFVDFSRYGLAKEPTVQESVAAGADLVTFSGDKLLGGPQAGIIVGRRPLVERIRANPLTRALRIDKLTLAALESTLRLYRDEAAAAAEIPTLRMLTEPAERIAARAAALEAGLKAIGDARLAITPMTLASKAGGGSLPLLDLPSPCLALGVRGLSASALEKRLRAGEPPVIVRIEAEAVIVDLRTVQPDETAVVAQALAAVLKELP